MKGSKGRLAVALVLTALLTGGAFASAAFAQSGSSSPSAGADDSPIRFTWGASTEPSSLNPMSGYLGTDFYFWTASYHLLINFDQNLGATDGLATKVQTSSDSMEFTYTIRDDVTWSDGEPLTADDVAYTLNLYKQNHAYLPQGYLTLIDGEVQVLDPTHIQFRTTQPTGLYTGKFPYMYDYILPKHIFEDIEKPKQYENVPSVSSGPFMITEYEVGEFVKLERNPYWTGPEPTVDELIYRIYKNEDALAQALKQGEVDFAYFTSPNIFNSLKNQPNIGTMAGTVPSFSEIGMNTGSAYQEPSGDFVPHGDGHPALTDLTVRRAIRMAISSEELQQKVLLGYGAPGDTIIPPVSVAGARWEPTGDDVIPWDIPGANQLLDDAGYLDTDGDGVREMPAGSLDPGRPLEFRYYVRTSEQTSVDAAPFVSEWLDQIGIKTERRGRDLGTSRRHHQRGDVRPLLVGLVPRPRPVRRAQRVRLRRATAGRQDLREQRPLLLQPPLRRSLRPAAGRARPRREVGDRPRDAADLLRGLRLRGHVVRPALPGVPDRSVHRVQPAAGAKGRPAPGLRRTQRHLDGASPGRNRNGKRRERDEGALGRRLADPDRRRDRGCGAVPGAEAALRRGRGLAIVPLERPHRGR